MPRENASASGATAGETAIYNMNEPTKNYTPVHSEDIAWLEKTLRGAGCWLHADELLVCKGETDSHAGKRWIRETASESGWIISGNDGYKHVVHATTEEIEHFVNRMQSQIDVMKRRIDTVQLNKVSLN